MCDTSAICPSCQGTLSDSNELMCATIGGLGERIERTYHCGCGMIVKVSAEVAGAAGSVVW